MLVAKLNVTILLYYLFHYITTSSREKTKNYHELFVNNVHITVSVKTVPMCLQESGPFLSLPMLSNVVTFKTYVNLVALQSNNSGLRFLKVGGYFLRFPCKFCQY